MNNKLPNFAFWLTSFNKKIPFCVIGKDAELPESRKIALHYLYKF
jgi:hypothetical protein